MDSPRLPARGRSKDTRTIFDRLRRSKDERAILGVDVCPRPIWPRRYYAPVRARETHRPLRTCSDGYLCLSGSCTSAAFHDHHDAPGLWEAVDFLSPTSGDLRAVGRTRVHASVRLPQRQFQPGLYQTRMEKLWESRGVCLRSAKLAYSALVGHCPYQPLRIGCGPTVGASCFAHWHYGC